MVGGPQDRIGGAGSALVVGHRGVGFERVAKDVKARVSGDIPGHTEGVVRVNKTQGGAKSPVSNASLCTERLVVEYSDLLLLIYD